MVAGELERDHDAAAGERGEDDRDEKRPGRDDGRHRLPSIAAIAGRAKRARTLVACPSSATSTARSRRAQSPSRASPGARADSLVARTGHLASGTLACPRCDAPVALGAGPAAPADPLGCPFCEHTATVRDFLSLADPTRPARVAVRVVHY